MKKGWTTTKLVAAGSMGILMLIFSLAGGILNTVIGMPGAGGFINTIVQTSLTAFAVLLVRQPGTATIIWFIFTFTAIPFPLMGPPGLFLKVFIGLFAGIISDIAHALTHKSEKLAASIVGGANLTAVGVALLSLAFIGIKWIAIFEKILKYWLAFPKVLLFLPPTFIVGMGLGYLGYLAYQKLKSTAVVKRIQGG